MEVAPFYVNTHCSIAWSRIILIVFKGSIVVSKWMDDMTMPWHSFLWWYIARDYIFWCSLYPMLSMHRSSHSFYISLNILSRKSLYPIWSRNQNHWAIWHCFINSLSLLLHFHVSISLLRIIFPHMVQSIVVFPMFSKVQLPFYLYCFLSECLAYTKRTLLMHWYAQT